MAVVTYTIGKDGTGQPTISPDVEAVEFRPGDYILFQGADSSIAVRVQMPLTDNSLGCVAAGRLSIRNPQLDKDGNVIVAFENLGGDGVGDTGFPESGIGN